jgi:hypothetical protein
MSPATPGQTNQLLHLVQASLPLIRRELRLSRRACPSYLASPTSVLELKAAERLPPRLWGERRYSPAHMAARLRARQLEIARCRLPGAFDDGRNGVAPHTFRGLSTGRSASLARTCTTPAAAGVECLAKALWSDQALPALAWSVLTRMPLSEGVSAPTALPAEIGVDQALALTHLHPQSEEGGFRAGSAQPQLPHWARLKC